MKHLLLATCFTLPSLSFAAGPTSAPANAAAPGCTGLQSSQGQLVKNSQKRQKTEKEMCGDDGEKVDQKLQGLKQKLQACKNLGKLTNGQTLAINGGDDVFNGLQQRFKRACKIHKNYTEGAQRLCDAYGNTAATTVATANSNNVGSNGQAKDFNKTSDLNAKAAQAYDRYAHNADTLHKNISDNMKDLKDGQDQEMNQYVKSRGQQIRGMSKAMLDQVNAHGVARTAMAAKQGAEQTIHLASQKDVDTFTTNLASCNEASSELDKLNKQYQESLAKELAQGKDESNELYKQFGDSEQQYGAQAAKDQATSESLGQANTSSLSKTPYGRQLEQQEINKGTQALKDANGDLYTATNKLTSGGYKAVADTKVNGVTYSTYQKSGIFSTTTVLMPKQGVINP